MQKASRPLWLLAVAVAVTCVGAGAAQGTGALAVEISTRARALAPGEAVVVRVRTSQPGETVTGTTPAGPLHFVRGSDPREWEALAGLGLRTAAGPYRIGVRAIAGGATADASLVLRVLPRTFPSRHITVDGKFARPPADQLARIERESKLLASVLAGLSPERLWGDGFAAPVPGGQTSAFGRVSVVNGERRSPHAGVDLQAAIGTPVRSPGGGRVVLSESLYLAGETVVIDHGLGVFSLLAHLSERRTAAGDAVPAGAIVGLSGVSGRITGPHLHWGVRIAGETVDPLSLLHVMGVTPPGSRGTASQNAPRPAKD